MSNIPQERWLSKILLLLRLPSLINTIQTVGKITEYI